jgi:MFS family permease
MIPRIRMALPGGLRALGHPDFRVFYAGQLAAMTGSWIQVVAQSWLVLELTGSPLRLGVIATLQFTPLLLLSLVAGVVADRLPRRGMLLATQATQAGLAVAVALLVATGRVQYWHLAVVAVGWGLAVALDQPARQVFVVDLVGRQDVASAIGLHAAGFNGARIVGPAIAGVVMGRLGIAAAFGLSAIVLAGATAALLGLAARPAAARPAATLREELREGIGYAMRTARIRLVLGLVVIVSLFVFNFSVYVPLLAHQVLGLGSEGFGFLMTALGVGAMAAGLGLGLRGGTQPPLVVLGGALGLACAGLLGLATVASVWVAVPLLAGIGFAATIVLAGCNTWLQLLAPDALRGRVMSLFTLLSVGVFPVGATWVGAVSEARGVAAAFLVNGGLGLLALAALLLWWRRRGA